MRFYEFDLSTRYIFEAGRGIKGFENRPLTRNYYGNTFNYIGPSLSSQRSITIVVPETDIVGTPPGIIPSQQDTDVSPKLVEKTFFESDLKQKLIKEHFANISPADHELYFTFDQRRTLTDLLGKNFRSTKKAYFYIGTATLTDSEDSTPSISKYPEKFMTFVSVGGKPQSNILVGKLSELYGNKTNAQISGLESISHSKEKIEAKLDPRSLGVANNSPLGFKQVSEMVISENAGASPIFKLLPQAPSASSLYFSSLNGQVTSGLVAAVRDNLSEVLAPLIVSENPKLLTQVGEKSLSQFFDSIQVNDLKNAKFMYPSDSKNYLYDSLIIVGDKEVMISSKGGKRPKAASFDNMITIYKDFNQDRGIEKSKELFGESFDYMESIFSSLDHKNNPRFKDKVFGLLESLEKHPNRNNAMMINDVAINYIKNNFEKLNQYSVSEYLSGDPEHVQKLERFISSLEFGGINKIFAAAREKKMKSLVRTAPLTMDKMGDQLVHRLAMAANKIINRDGLFSDNCKKLFASVAFLQINTTVDERIKQNSNKIRYTGFSLVYPAVYEGTIELIVTENNFRFNIPIK
jgi:hypothetical protein